MNDVSQHLTAPGASKGGNGWLCLPLTPGTCHGHWWCICRPQRRVAHTGPHTKILPVSPSTSVRLPFSITLPAFYTFPFSLPGDQREIHFSSTTLRFDCPCFLRPTLVCVLSGPSPSVRLRLYGEQAIWASPQCEHGLSGCLAPLYRVW